MSITGDKAKRATVAIGALSVDGFQMTDGSYRMSQAGAATTINESPVYALSFLDSGDSNALLGEDFMDYAPEQIEVEISPGDRGQTRINALPLEEVAAYWLYRSFEGHKVACTLTWALPQAPLECRFEATFGVERSEGDRNALLAQRLQSDLTTLGETYAETDELREQVARLEQRLATLV